MRNMAHPNMFMVILLVLLAWLPNSGASASRNKNINYVRDACTVTRYRDLCIHSLAPFSSTARRSPSKWARAGVSVTIGEVKSVTLFLFKLKKRARMRGRNRVALSDCIECFQSTIDELHRSLGILRKLSARDFDTQMADLTTFMSAALTDEDTCLDGFGGQTGRQVNLLKKRILKTTYLTSNALALVNKLATTGLESIPDP
ncbi:21 kDa protein [Melia azedarach]|uniref:21 kDa protein n=1 Tax=Melia azedarach TaxID=155640 RepID=A0ACC1YXB2_MELAZ|nr:21 kDa protein [Melia azedarach]